MDDENKVNYYAIIPATIRYSKYLKPNEKLLYGEITALSNRNGYCYAQNRYFSKLYNVSIHTVSQWISHLEKLGYIKLEMIKSLSKEIKERRIFINDIPYVQKNTYPYIQKSTEGIDKKVQENNIKYNIDDLFILIINNSKEISKEFYKQLERLEFVYSQELVKNMKQENIQKLKEIIYTIYCIDSSNFKGFISRFERNTLIKLYMSCKEHNTSDFINYYKQSIINEYMER